MVHVLTKRQKRVPVVLIAQCQDATRTPVLIKQERKLIDCIVHLFLVYVWFSGKEGVC